VPCDDPGKAFSSECSAEHQTLKQSPHQDYQDNSIDALTPPVDNSGRPVDISQERIFLLSLQTSLNQFKPKVP